MFSSDNLKIRLNRHIMKLDEVLVKTEKEDAEINAMALKLKEIYRKNALATARQISASPAKVYTNKANRTVALVMTSAITNNNTQKNNEEEILEQCEDIESGKLRFSWKSIAGFHLPYIIRLINGEYLKFVSTRMAETHLLSNYLHHLHSDIYTSCTSVNGHFITNLEAKLLNDINYNHTNCVYGKEIFIAGKDFIASLEDVHEFYTFIEVCYKKLLCNVSPDHNEICGFIRINSESVVPYCIKDGQKFVPMFYFEGETENLINRAIKLENWNLSYLKFCCKVQGIRNELFASNSCTVARLDDIKKYFPPDTNFEEYWPAKVVDSYLLTNQKSTHVSPSSAWIRAPPEVVPLKNTISHTLPAPAPVPQGTPVIMNTYQNGWPPNQMVNSYSTHVQPTSTTHAYSMLTGNQNMPAHCYNTFSMDSRDSTMSQSNISLSGMGHVLPPPLVHAGSTTPVIGQYMTTMYNPMTNGNVMSYSNQIRQVYSQRTINNSQAQQQLQQQQQQIISTPQTQQSYSGQPVYGRFTNTQQRNALRNVAPIITTEIIDLSTPPSSPVPSPEPETSLCPNVGWVLTRIPERKFLQGSSTSAAYKIQKTTLQGQTIHCINAKPYIYSDLMVTLDDLVKMMLPSCTIERCAHILNKFLKTTLFSGNSEQLSVLQDNGRIRSMYPEDTPMAMLQDIVKVFLQLRTLVSKSDDEIQQIYQYVGVPSKRQRTS